MLRSALVTSMLLAVSLPVAAQQVSKMAPPISLPESDWAIISQLLGQGRFNEVAPTINRVSEAFRQAEKDKEDEKKADEKTKKELEEKAAAEKFKQQGSQKK